MIHSEEVSSRATAVLCGELDRRGIPVFQVIEGMSLTEAQLRGGKPRLSWEDYVEFAERITQRIGGPEGWSQSHPDVHKSPGNEVAFAIARAFVKPSRLHWMVAKWIGPSYFRHVHFEFELKGPNRARFVMEIPEDYSGSIPFFHIWLHGLRFAPSAIGLPEAIIDAKITSHRGEYDILFPPSLSLVGRFKVILALFGSGRTVIAELASRESEVGQYYERLAKVQEALLEREKQLRQSSEQASLARLSALGEMAGGIAHEINNPLSIVLIQAEQLVRLIQRLPAEYQQPLLEKAEGIIKDSKRTAETVRALRLISRDAGNDPLEAIRVADLVQDALQFCSSRFGTLGIEIQTIAISSDATIEGRRVPLVQALLSCLNNACDAVMGQDARWIRIECPRPSNHATLVEIIISDSGAGIQPELRDKVFQPFFTTKKLGSGAGLGLSTARGVIESHGGQISFDLTAPRTRLVIRLPRSDRSPQMVVQ